MNLDFSQLTNDQLVDLVRACCQEGIARGQAVAAALQGVALTESEKAQVIREAADREAGKLRAMERERLARETAEQVRREAAAAQRAADELRKGSAEAERLERERAAAVDAAAQAKIAADKAIEETLHHARRRLAWLERFSAIVAIPVNELNLVLFGKNGSRRVLLNKGQDRYTRSHLVDVNVGTSEISTSKSLVRSKPELLQLALEFAIDRAAANVNDLAYVGAKVLETIEIYSEKQS